jgi:4-amino-4-deoxy-L-arabinose transferase-like glycosyltransferase
MAYGGIMRKTWIEVVIIILVAGFIMFFQLGELPLLDPDEPVYAQTAREMLATNDFISPRIYGDFWYDKPPMYYWLVSGSFKLLGQNEFTARFPSAFLAVCGGLLVYFGGKSLMNQRAGFIAALVLSTSIEYFYLGKAAVTDMTLTFFLTATLLCYLQRKYYLAYIAAGLAVLTKGPIGIVFPGMIVLLHLLLTKNLQAVKHIKVISGGFLVVLVSLPWYLAMYHFHGMDFINTFLGFHNITRFLEPEHSAGALWYYYIPVLLVGFFPWAMFLVQSLWSSFRNRNQREGNIPFFFFIWAMVVFVFFSISQTKLVSYILPMYPPLALLVGRYIDQCIAEGTPGIFKKPAMILTFLIIALQALIVFAAAKSMPSLLPGALVTGVVFAVMVGGIWLSSSRKSNMEFISVVVAGMMAFVIVLMTHLFPAVAPSFTVKNFTPKFQEHYDGKAPVYIAKFYRPGFTYYVGNPGIELASNKQLVDLVTKDSEAMYFVIRKKDYLGLPAAERDKLQFLDNEDNIVLLRKN